MEKDIIKMALSYSLGSDMHEAWREPRKQKDGSYEPRIKKSKDESWNLEHGTDEVDIANLSFSELPSNWQFENLEAAKVVVDLVFENVMEGIKFSDEELDSLGSIIHDEWLKRNEWVFDKEYGNPSQAVPYSELSKEEQDKDKAQIEVAIKKIEDYKKGNIDIQKLCEQYKISLGKTI